MQNFAAIDFETANSHPSSVCSVGIIVVRNGAVYEKFYELIQPAPNFYNFWNSKIHGLDQRHTNSAEPFPVVWGRAAEVIKNLPLVAHNSPFDQGCLRAAHAHYGMTYPAYEFLCTCRGARRAFPHLPNHKLHTVAGYVGFNLTEHHHALADAEACAAIAMAIWG
jgi:DNA polymerase-3 subunit epsilon